MIHFRALYLLPGYSNTRPSSQWPVATYPSRTLGPSERPFGPVQSWMMAVVAACGSTGQAHLGFAEEADKK